MDRRSVLTAMLGRKKTTGKANNAPASVLSSLTPYSGTWDFAAAKHLLGRTMYGPTYAEIQQAVEDGLAATIAQLFAPQQMPAPPIYYDFNNDPNVPLGETWVDTPPPVPPVMGLNGARRRSLNAWTFGLMLNGGVSIREKMVLFWHNHFVTSQINRTQYVYKYISTIRENALGNFKTLTEAITVDPAMLVYLNGNQNTRNAPNENYARELLELFTIGKGPAAGPGDYTTYTEQDIAEIARALTGWVNGAIGNPSAVVGSFIPQRHDNTAKQLSHRFNNVVIQNAGDQEYKNVIDIIFQQDEVARFISRRLHVWFVGANIDATVEAEVIEPMAALIRNNDYDIQPALEALLSSEYFFEESRRGCMVNHPIDHLFKILRPLKLELPAGGILAQYRAWINLARQIADQEMVLFDIPSVAGWKAFYQAPQYYDSWINSVSMPLREKVVKQFVAGFSIGNQTFELDLLGLLTDLEEPSDPHSLINDLAETLFAFPIADNQLDFLTDYLIQGGPYYTWSYEYLEYLEDPDDENKRLVVVNKLKALVEAMLKMPEFYLI
jgi:uncharacterized protein (DUF1800 family)